MSSPAIRVGAPVGSAARLRAAVADPARLAALDADAEAILDRQSTPTFDRFARLASAVADVPVALVSVVTEERQYFAGLCGLPEPWCDIRETPLSHSFCQHVVANATPLVVADARADPVLCANLAIPDLDVVAYAGFPIVSPTGHVLGSLCAIDHAPRDWDSRHLEALADLALLVGNELHRRHLMRRLSVEARTDVLTGLANRRAWEEELPGALRRAERLGYPISVALLDVDRFKAFNDRHGHPAGDAALRRIGARWGAQVRDIDLLARIGGEEFALLLPGCDAPAALLIVERLRRATPDALSASAGLVGAPSSLTPEQVMAAADRALYLAKAEGRNRACIGSAQAGV